MLAKWTVTFAISPSALSLQSGLFCAACESSADMDPLNLVPFDAKSFYIIFFDHASAFTELQYDVTEGYLEG